MTVDGSDRIAPGERHADRAGDGDGYCDWFDRGVYHATEGRRA